MVKSKPKFGVKSTARFGAKYLASFMLKILNLSCLAMLEFYLNSNSKLLAKGINLTQSTFSASFKLKSKLSELATAITNCLIL
jgi:hypothetical protein